MFPNCYLYPEDDEIVPTIILACQTNLQSGKRRSKNDVFSFTSIHFHYHCLLSERLIYAPMKFEIGETIIVNDE